MKIKVTIEDNESGKVTQVEKDCDGFLTDVSGVFTDVVSAAYGYPVHVVTVTEFAAWDREGVVE